MKANTSVELRDRKIFSIDEFGGADFTTPPQKITTSQAQYMENFIVEGKRLKKRNGWKEIANFDGRINGIFKYKTYLLIHAGTRLYKYTGSSYASVPYSGETTLADEKSQAFENEEKLYIICNGLYIYNGSSIHKVGVSDVYIPTTSVSVEGESGDTVRSSLEEINLLTPWRKNSLLGKKDTDSSYYYLDAEAEEIESVNCYKKNFMGVYTWSELEESEYEIGNYNPRMLHIKTDVTPPVENEDNIIVTFKTKDSEDFPSAFDCGCVFGMEERSDRLFLASGNKEFFSASGNFLYFPAGNIAVIGNSEPITGFGRLSDGTLCIYKKDKIYYQIKSISSSTDDNGNLSYYKENFPVTEGASGYGCTNPFLANNLSSDTLIANPDGVFGIAINDGSTRTKRNTEERSYPISKKLKEYSMEDAYSCVHDGKYYLSFGNGDCFVADARRRYRPYESLDSYFNYEWYYMTNVPARVMSCVNGILYFGTSYEKTDEEGNVVTYGGKLCEFDEEYSDREYYLSDKGELGIEYLEGSGGHLIIAEDVSKLIEKNTKIETTEDLFWVLTDGVCAREESRLYIPEPEAQSDIIDLIYDQMFIRLDAGDNTELTGPVYETQGTDYISGTYMWEGGLEFKGYEPYRIVDLDKATRSFALLDSKGKSVSFSKSDVPIRMIMVTDNGYYEIRKDDMNGYKRYYYGNLLDIAKFGGAEQKLENSRKVRLLFKNNICAKWYSPVWALGSDIYLKTLLSITFSGEASSGEDIGVYYETRKNISEFRDRGTSTLDFNSLSFENFSFESDFAKAYTKRVFERNFNYITLRIVSDGTNPCYVNNITLKYKINKYAKGVK